MCLSQNSAIAVVATHTGRTATVFTQKLLHAFVAALFVTATEWKHPDVLQGVSG